jgi:hypothetical protein
MAGGCGDAVFVLKSFRADFAFVHRILRWTPGEEENDAETAKPLTPKVEPPERRAKIDRADMIMLMRKKRAEQGVVACNDAKM